MTSRIRRSVGSIPIMAALLSMSLLGSVAVAQSDSAAKPTQSDDGTPLEEAMRVRAGGNEGAAKVQTQIDAVSDKTSQLLAEYRTALKQIEAIDLYNAQMNEMISSQEIEIASLHEQVDRVEEVSRSVTPLMIRMITALEKFVELDVPFLIEERTERMEELEAMMGRADVSTSEKFRQIMAAYQTENEYGRTIEAYRGPLVIDGRETTVDFLRFGRVVLVYMALDESGAGVWSQADRAWVPVDDSYKSSIRSGLRIARKQTAPDLISLPVPAAVAARGDG